MSAANTCFLIEMFFSIWQHWDSNEMEICVAARRWRHFGERDTCKCLFARMQWPVGWMLKGVRNVINYDKPAAAYIKTYIHRAGPRARAGQNGHCFTLLPKDEEFCHLDSFPLLGLFFTTVWIYFFSPWLLIYGELNKIESYNSSLVGWCPLDSG